MLSTPMMLQKRVNSKVRGCNTLFFIRIRIFAIDLVDSTFDVSVGVTDPTWRFPKLTMRLKVTLANQQADSKSPLYSAKSFEELGLYVCFLLTLNEELISDNRSPELLKGLYEMDFSRPSKIQERALPLLLSDPYV